MQKISNSFQIIKNNQPQFKGTIRQSFLLEEHAKKYAKGIKAFDADWTKLRIFINTLRAVKNDSSQQELIIGSINDYMYLQYGDYFRKEIGKLDVLNKMNKGRDIFNMVVLFGKEYYGIRNLNHHIEEFSIADYFIHRAINFFSQARLPKNQKVSKKLLQKANIENQRAENAAGTVRLEIINNL